MAIAYAEEAVEDTERDWACRWIRLASKRFLSDLRRSQSRKPPFYFSARRANAHCEFIENLPHIEGEWNTPTITLEPFQIFFIVNLFGFRNLAGGRRFTEALFAIARKNAKSTLAAAILASVLCLENENGGQIISAATTGSQARIVWALAKQMIDRSPDLRDAFDVDTTNKYIARWETGATYKPINAKASTQDGLNPSAIGFDEIHAHKTHDLVNVLRSAAGARKSPLTLYTTTEGYLNPGPWPELRNFARQVLEGMHKDADHFLAVIYALDDDDEEKDEFNEKKWIKANPLMPVNPLLLTEMRKLATASQSMPGTHAEFRIKRLNLPAAHATAWLNLPKWKKCAGPVDLERLRGAPCVGAFDLANTRDMTAWVMLWMLEGEFYCRARYWVPEDAVQQRTERRTVPYAGWVKAGHIIQTPGTATDYSIIEKQILADCEEFSPSRVAADPWNATSTSTNLINNGVPVEQFIQGPRSYNPAMKACELAYTSARLHHGGNPVLTWNAANVVARKDVNLNEAPDRKRSADKIDGMCALFMCFGLMAADDSEAFSNFLDNVVSA